MKINLLSHLFNPLTKQISNQLYNRLSKKLEQQIKPKEVDTKTKQWDVPFGWNYPDSGKMKKKPEGYVNFDTLRNFSVHYPIARACIDYLKSKIQKLNWAIVSKEEETKINQNNPNVKVLEYFFQHPSGERSNYREFIDAIIEDYCVIGAVALEKIFTRGSQFTGELKLVDSATIRCFINEDGRLPEPPDPAYAQVVGGMINAQLTQDEMIYKVKNKRTNTIYGLSPIESIIVQAKAALQGSLYSLNWFTEGNMPEGFLKMPKEYGMDQIKDFERYFNSMLSGNLQNVRKIKPIPEGSEYIPIKKPQDVGYEQFELWILQLSCSVFGVPPQDIGFTYQVNKSSADVQANLGQERGLRPLAQFIEGMFNEIIERDFGINDLEFKYVDINPVDAKLEAEVEKIRIESGVLSVDEVRTKEGLTPIGLNHYISGNVKLVEDVINPEYRANANQPKVEVKMEEKEEEKEEESKQKLAKQDLLLWRKKAKRDMERGIKLKRFNSLALDKWIIDEIYSQLDIVEDKKMVDVIFEPYLNNTAQIYNQILKYETADNITNTQAN
jgi:HK97 family phage portal protein